MFRALRGILDLRTEEDAYLDSESDWGIASRLDEVFDRLDFECLLDHYFDLVAEVEGPISQERRQAQTAHIRAASGRARRWLEALQLADGDALLDLGCGPGSLLIEASRRSPTLRLWGVDIAMRWLILARKRLIEEGVPGVGLVCGCAERLPFLDGRFAGIIGGDVIEHVNDPLQTLNETHRVLSSRGRLVMATPNRFSLTPEPHVRLWALGYLPRSWMPGYVRWRLGTDYRAIWNRSRVGWADLLQRSQFGRGRVDAAHLEAEDLEGAGPAKRWLGRTYNRFLTTGLGRALAGAVGPSLWIEARRDPDPTLATNSSMIEASEPSHSATFQTAKSVKVHGAASRA